MDYHGTGPQPPAAYPPAKKAFPIAAVVLGIVCLLGVLAVFGGIHAYRAISKNSTEAIAVGDSFIDNLGHHNYAAAHALFTAPVQAKTSAGDLKDIETLVEKHHGAYLAHGQPQWFVQNMNGQTSVRLTYPARFTKNSSPIAMVLIQTDKGYQVYQAHYDF